jgi:hypothetical protein
MRLSEAWWLSVLVALGCAPPISGKVAVHPDGQGFRDAAGRQVLLRGVNLRGEGLFDISKVWLPLAPFTADDCARLADDFGMNFIRLPLSWSLLEPTQGTLDPALLSRVKALIQACRDEGISTLVDLHQDGWSKYVGDDGAPLWAHAEPLPPADGSGGGGSEFFQPDIAKNYRAFYDDALQAARAEFALIEPNGFDVSSFMVDLEAFFKQTTPSTRSKTQRGR